jgi:hypothetical protein
VIDSGFRHIRPVKAIRARTPQRMSGAKERTEYTVHDTTGSSLGETDTRLSRKPLAGMLSVSACTGHARTTSRYHIAASPHVA